MDVDALLAEQVAYYRARAAEYDDWWERRDRYDQGPEFLGWWRSEIGRLAAWIAGEAPLGRVLELAAGTGNLTVLLAPHAESLVAVDTSVEALEVNRAKTAGSDVRHVVGDVFAWQAAERFDTVAFGFWLSHVPAAYFDRFWERVVSWLAPGGRALFVDNRLPDGDGRRRHRLTADSVNDYGAGTARRTLRDGRSFDIVKVFWDPADLERRLAESGWGARVGRTDGAFIHGTARPAAEAG